MYTKAQLRALGEGVQGLRNGDIQDRQIADQTEDELRVAGYTLCGYNFVRTSQVLVTSHLHPDGAHKDVLDESDRKVLLSLPGVKQLDLFNLPESVADILGGMIRDMRIEKRLSADPEDLR